MKRFICVIFTLLLFCGLSNAQSIIETFDSNSLNWNECASESNAGTSIINEGKLTITSKGSSKFWAAMMGVQPSATYFTCFCYAPINVKRSFTITTDVTIGKLDDNKLVGLVFNYKDDGTFYAFVFDDVEVRFLRYVDNRLVGAITQSVKWKKTRAAQQMWKLESDGSTLSFFVDDLQIMNVRYMPLEYSGFGFYTYGNQKLLVKEVEFVQ